jgi:hypothetical protein
MKTKSVCLQSPLANFLRTLGKSLTLVLLGLGLSTPVQAVVVGSPGSGGNCFPFGCAFLGGASTPSTRYQQVYDDALLPAITISEIRFFLSSAGNLNSGTYTLRLSHSANPVDALDTTVFDNNVGSDDALFGVFVLTGGAAPATLSFAGTPFAYDGIGDLLLDIQIAGIGHTGLNSFQDSRSGNAGGLFSRAHDFGTGFTGFGLVTEFVQAAQQVPEPATLVLLGAGLAALGFARRPRAAQ